jgi:RHS repeat-associated protein
MTDASGGVAERYSYAAYGGIAVLAIDGSTIRSSSLLSNSFTYTGQRHDDETELQYYRARYRDSQLGRFISRDPIGYVEGGNVYQYVQSQPTIAVDPTGHCKGPHATPADQAKCCRESGKKCKSKCLKDHGDAVVTPDLLDCYNGCNKWEATCGGFLVPNVPMLECDSTECDKYEEDDEYFNTKAKCFCKCAGDTPWSQYVRGCLREMYEQEVDPHDAHMLCYSMASNQGFGRPDLTLAYCLIRCWDYDPTDER